MEWSGRFRGSTGRRLNSMSCAIAPGSSSLAPEGGATYSGLVQLALLSAWEPLRCRPCDGGGGVTTWRVSGRQRIRSIGTVLLDSTRTAMLYWIGSPAQRRVQLRLLGY